MFRCRAIFRQYAQYALVILLTLPGEMSLAAAPATEPTLQASKQEEYARQLAEKNGTPIKVMDLHDVIHVAVRDGKLVVYSPIQNATWLRIGLGNSLVLCMLREPAADFFQLTLDDFTDPANIYMQTDVLTGPDQVQIVGSWEFQHSERFVTLMQKDAGLDTQGRKTAGQVRMIVQELNENGGEGTNITLTAANWGSLLREYPNEVRKYFRPVLRKLQADQLMQPDPQIEWQVFGPKATPNPAIMAQAQKILPLLDNESFVQRQDAMRQLTRMGSEGAIALMHIDTRQLSAEQSARVADVLLPYHQLSSEEVEKLSRQPEFLLDCMEADDVRLRQLAAKQLASVWGHQFSFDAEGAARDREAQMEQLRNDLEKKK